MAMVNGCDFLNIEAQTSILCHKASEAVEGATGAVVDTMNLPILAQVDLINGHPDTALFAGAALMCGSFGPAMYPICIPFGIGMVVEWCMEVFQLGIYSI